MVLWEVVRRHPALSVVAILIALAIGFVVGVLAFIGHQPHVPVTQ